MKRLTYLVATLALIATAALANGNTPTPGPKAERPEPDKASAAASADLCNVPTSTPPAGYAADATTWPCKNFSK